MLLRLRALIGLLACSALLSAQDANPPAAEAKAKAGPTMADIIKAIDPNGNTELAVKDFWNRTKGTKVNWEGVVLEVEGGRSKAEILFACYEFQTYRGYNVVVSTFDQSGAAKLKKGSKASFTGVLKVILVAWLAPVRHISP